MDKIKIQNLFKRDKIPMNTTFFTFFYKRKADDFNVYRHVYT